MQILSTISQGAIFRDRLKIWNSWVLAINGMGSMYDSLNIHTYYYLCVCVWKERERDRDKEMETEINRE